jgi:putative FmdB family regulatory protein
MPIYDYRCSDCGNHFELLVMSATTPVCPICGSQHLEKQVSCPAAPGRSAALVARGRAQAARAGHFSNYEPSERKRR